MRYLFGLLLAFAQQPAQNQEFVPQDHRPPLFFKEDFKAPPQGIQEMPISQRFIENSNLELKTYGPGKELIQIDHHWDAPKTDPNFVWTGLTPASWALALKREEQLCRLDWPRQDQMAHRTGRFSRAASNIEISQRNLSCWRTR